MQILIDVNESDYKSIKELRYVPVEFAKDIAESIIGGVILPKGHGRLIDADKLDIHASTFDICEIENALTIIEADKRRKMKRSDG